MGIIIGIGDTSSGGYDAYYGVEWDTANSTPTLTRVGSPRLHQELPVQSGMRRCLVTDDGQVTYLHASDSTKKEDGTAADLSGAAGQVMVEIPEHYRRFAIIGTKRRVLLATKPVEGFVKVPKMYVSAYEAALDHTNNKLASVVNTTAQYRGGNNTAAWDGTYHSLLGLPATNISTTDFRTKARARGTGWEMYAYEAHKAIYWLFVTEYATLNSQAAYNADLTAEGYHQGGLGDGVSNFSNWSAYNSYNPIIPCGFTNSLGNATGVKTFTLDADQAAAYGSAHSESVPSYRGIENPFGHIWKMTDGAMMVSETVDEVATPHFYVCPLEQRAHFASSKNSYYELKGTLASANEWAKTHLGGDGGEMVPSKIGGSSSTYMCDYFYITNSSTRAVGFGGSASGGAYDGLAFASTYYDFSYAYAFCGSRLCYFPS